MPSNTSLHVSPLDQWADLFTVHVPSLVIFLCSGRQDTYMMKPRMVHPVYMEPDYFGSKQISHEVTKWK